MSLNICVNLEISIVNTYAEIIDRCRLLHNVQINNMSLYYANNALYSEIPINTFNNIQKYCILSILLYHNNISHCTYLFRVEFWHNHFNNRQLTWVLLIGVKGKVVYGQEPPSGESTTTECGFNYQLLAVITEVAQWWAPSCSQPQPATDNGIRDGRSNWLVAPPALHRAVPPELHVLHTAMRAANHKTCCTESAANVRLQNARPTHCWCGHSGYLY